PLLERSRSCPPTVAQLAPRTRRSCNGAQQSGEQTSQPSSTAERASPIKVGTNAVRNHWRTRALVGPFVDVTSSDGKTYLRTAHSVPKAVATNSARAAARDEVVISLSPPPVPNKATA